MVTASESRLAGEKSAAHDQRNTLGSFEIKSLDGFSIRYRGQRQFCFLQIKVVPRVLSSFLDDRAFFI